MNAHQFIIGLPVSTFLFGGGLFLLSMLLPTVLVIFLRRREAKNNE